MESLKKSAEVDVERIWFLPQKYWQATNGMSEEAKSELMLKVEHYAEIRDLQALRQYPFIHIGNLYSRSRGNAA